MKSNLSDDADPFIADNTERDDDDYADCIFARYGK